MTMTNIDRAAEVLWLPEPHLSDSECDDQACELAQALADAGLLTPAPNVIRTVEELEALDSDTLVLDAAGHTVRYGSQVTRWDLPLAIIREGAEVRAARKALEEA